MSTLFIKGDEILSAGTANEIIEKMGITETHKRAYEADKSNRRTIVAIKSTYCGIGGLNMVKIKRNTNRWHIHYLR